MLKLCCSGSSDRLASRLEGEGSVEAHPLSDEAVQQTDGIPYRGRRGSWDSPQISHEEIARRSALAEAQELELMRMLEEEEEELEAADAKNELGTAGKVEELDLEREELDAILCDPGLYLCQAAKQNHVSAVRQLLQHRAHVDSANGDRQDPTSRTPLQVASERGRIEVVKVLLSNKADINRATPDCLDTSLHLAARKGYMDIIKLLVTSGADVQKKNGRGQIPAAVADDEGLEDIAWWLKASKKIM